MVQTVGYDKFVFPLKLNDMGMDDTSQQKIVEPRQKHIATLVLVIIVALLFWANFLAGIVAAIVLPFHFYYYLRARPKTKADALNEKELEIQRAVMRPYIKHIVLVVLGVLVLNIIIYALTKNSGFIFIFDFVALFSAVVVASSLYRKQRRGKDTENMVAVSREMGFAFSPVGDISTLHERLLVLGQEPEKSRITNVFSGTLEGYPTRIFDFYYVWLKKAAYTATLLEITNSRKCPKMLIVSKKDDFGDTFTPSSIFPCVVVKLEGNFSDYFSLFVESGAEDEIRQILTPDLMVVLIDTMSDLSFMFFDDKLYVVLTNNSEHGFLKDDFVNQMNKAKFVMTKWSPTLMRMGL